MCDYLTKSTRSSTVCETVYSGATQTRRPPEENDLYSSTDHPDSLETPRNIDLTTNDRRCQSSRGHIAEAARADHARDGRKWLSLF